MMDLKRFHAYTLNFLKGKLAKNKEKELLNWITVDNENKQLFLRKQEQLSSELILQKNAELDRTWNILVQKINRGEYKKTLPYLGRLWPIAATFLLGALLTMAILPQINFGGTEVAAIHNVYTPKGARTSLSLPDGSMVWLNAGTTLSYPNDFRKTRQVYLDGEAFFEVEKSDKPFSVTTTYGQVQVKGTSFNVKAYPEEPMETTLVEGSVVLKSLDSGREAVLNPGQQATIESGRLKISSVEPRLIISWKDGKLIFSKEPFPSFIEKLERWYNVTISYQDPKLDELWYTGTIEMETISEVMEMISKAAPVSYSFDNKTRIFMIKSNFK